ncbi:MULTISPECIES: guanylate kinase [Dehalococcoides]|jgi:guanylate kinase|uniref:guanylate kinase n=1 Tax=Dehalococcoides TaxID=61434 RepID=UPI0003C858E4|nr:MULTISPECIES: guanylate kinase [Dehalococcoides]AHB12823.1 guanylate kinase [Dehalococcoides mccartyi GY50]APH11783.1 guanylate kinase [Dehalococcoides mccartyi]QYY58620.1 guanylate kinase [Dehalococcoides mccartyi]BAQ33991.1 guanylate kinase [Dehalococcoides sp. UCH007]
MTNWNFNKAEKPLLLVVSGPSGVGKDAVLARMKERKLPLTYVVTTTTRPKRETETEGVDYNFIKPSEFQQLIGQNELLEWANVYGNFYGVPKAPIRQALSRGFDVIVKVDVQGAASIKKIVPNAVFIFLMPPDMEELTRRLEQRLTESPESLKRRLATAPLEIEKLPDFDYVVVNPEGEIDNAVREIMSIIAAEHCRIHPRSIEL